MVQWTQEQQQAIETRNKNLLVSAGAGSGKTAVLTERIVRLILDDGVDADRFVVMTFTKAAAAEMKARIRKSLYARMAVSEDKKSVYRQIELLEQAQISTIHSFCLSVIKSYYYIIGIDPLSSMLSESEIDILQQEALEELFEKRYDENHDSFLVLSDVYSQGNDDEPLKQTLIRIAKFVWNRTDPKQWLEEAATRFDRTRCPIEEHPAIIFLMKYVRDVLDDAFHDVSEGLELCLRYDDDPKRKRTEYMTQMREDLDCLCRSSNDLHSFMDAFDGFSVPRYDIRSNCEASDAIKAHRNRAKELIDQLKKMFGFSYDEVIKQIDGAYPVVDALVRACIDFMELFSEKKSEKTAMDYTDLEHYALRILQDEAVRNELRDRYEYIFVDEYQDTNAIQEAIIGAITGDDNLFAVGDIKQSIYRFRGAEPEIFTARYERYQNHDQFDSELIFLNRNFRSQPTIIGAINHVFGEMMFRDTGGVDYAPNEALKAGLDGSNPFQAELHIVESDSADEERFDESNYTRYEVEADYIASYIQQLLTQTIHDGEKERPIEPKDIAVIGRSLKAKADIYTAAIKRLGIPVESEQGNRYYDEIEVALVIDLLRVIDNVRNDIPLIGVMRSFLFAFTPDELLKIRQHCKDAVYFHEAMFDYVIKGNDEKLVDKIGNMIDVLADYREKSRHVSIERFLRMIYEEHQILSYVSSLPEGAARTENLKYLLQLASSYELATFKGLYHFISFVEVSRKRESAVNAPKKSQSESSVRLMTVHKSKGLEFPIVIFAGCADTISNADARNDLILHKTFGICPNYHDPEQMYYSDTIFKTAAKKRLQLETAAEEMRILYVGMTRAMHKLVLVGTIKTGEMEKRIERIPRSKREIAEADSYLSWILSALCKDDPSCIQDGFSTDEWNVICKSWYPDMTVTVLDAQRPEHSERTTDQEDINAIRKIFSYRYPHQPETKLPSKVSVTQLKNDELLAYDEQVVALAEAPRFASEEVRLSGAQIGTLSHRFLALADLAVFRDRCDQAQIVSQIGVLTENGIFTQEEAAYLDIASILSFLTSEIGTKMLQAEEVYRETPFLIRRPACDLREEWADAEAQILVQGVIDCWFVYEREIYLLDYKTDHAYDEVRYEALIASYRKQLSFYNVALKESIGSFADHCTICFISMGRYEALEMLDED